MMLNDIDKTKIIGLTGAIASGKSSLSSMLKDLGAYVIDADIVARDIVKKGQPALKDIEYHFGREYLKEDGELNRKKLGDLVFNNPSKLKLLNKISHPRIEKAIIEDIEKRIKDYEKDLIIIDAALLLEIGWDRLVDEVWLVYADKKDRIDRLMLRNGFSYEEALSRVESQGGPKLYLDRAHRVFYNTKNLDYLKKQLIEALDKGGFSSYLHGI